MDPTGDGPQYPVHAPGWAALDRALAALYPGQVPHQFASNTAYETGSRSPLPAISVYEAPDHWLYVTYGLSELFEKSSDNPDVSGFGFEVTFRLLGTGSTPPAWPLRLLQGIGGHVLGGHGALDTGHVVDLGGPMCPEADGRTALEGVVCVPDPGLGKLHTEHGSVLLLLMWGLTRDELTALQGWAMDRKVGLVHAVAPSGVTDVGRPPLRENRQTAAIFRRFETGILI